MEELVSKWPAAFTVLDFLMHVVYMGDWQTDNDAGGPASGPVSGPSTSVTTAKALYVALTALPVNPQDPFLGKVPGHPEKKSS
jgi:hypothetical protein